MEVDLGGLAERADAERDRLTGRLTESCARIDPGGRRWRWPASWSATIRTPTASSRPPGTGRSGRSTFTRERDLVPYHDGECLVGLAPESRRWAMAMMSPAAPGEPEGPSWYHITPPDDVVAGAGAGGVAGSLQRRRRCPASPCTRSRPGTSRTAGRCGALPPPSGARCISSAFVEGWAHYAEELCVEEGFSRRRPPVRDRRLAGGPGPGHPAGLRHRRAHRRDDRGGGRPAGSSPTPTWSGRPRCPRPAGPPSTRPTAGTPGASSRSWTCASRPGRSGAPDFSLRRFHTGHAGARLAAARPARHRGRPRLTASAPPGPGARPARRPARPRRPSTGPGSPDRFGLPDPAETGWTVTPEPP